MRLTECRRCGAQDRTDGRTLLYPDGWETLGKAILCPACVERALEKPETGTHPFVEVKGACGVCGTARFTSLHPAAVVRQVLSG